MCCRLRPILSRWELEPPVFAADEIDTTLQTLMPRLRDQAVLRPISPVEALTCFECGERRRVESLRGQAGQVNSYLHCHCGISAIAEERLKRWRINSPALIREVFHGLGLSVEEKVSERLWRVGVARWAGRTREVWFVRAFQPAVAKDAVDFLARRPKAIVFGPTERGADLWQKAIDKTTLSLESALIDTDDWVALDTSYVEERVDDAGRRGVIPPRRPRKRASRAAKIELLKRAMIKHLQDARDHARDSFDRTGERKHLPRPTQKALGELMGLSAADVCRCLKDPQSRELQLYWDMAASLDQIVDWKGAISVGRSK